MGNLRVFHRVRGFQRTREVALDQSGSLEPEGK